MAPSTLRDTVLRAAVDYIAQNGPDGLSFRQVAADAGVSHQAPYHHFTDRQGIFQAIAREGFTMFVGALRNVDNLEESDRALSLLERYVDFAVEHRGHFRVMFRADLCVMDEDPELQAIADDAFGVLVSHATAILGPGASVDDIRARATAMWALAHGLATLLTDGPLEVKIGQIADRHAFVRSVGMQTSLTNPR
ncbi:MAG: TetR/AcrR family transcriptional regulator [Ilumatobacteraceae bacterium]|nr:TetR/AcrR family transcriptional regulator [Ilumatobacteraceae bacterium]